MCLITVAFTKCYGISLCSWHGEREFPLMLVCCRLLSWCHVHSSYIICFWCYNDCHLLVPKHHSFLSICHPPVSCRLIIAASFPSYWTSMDTHISLWLGYMMHYSFYGSCVMSCTYPTTIDLMFCIWLIFYTHYFCYSFVLTLFMPDTVADLK